MAEKKKRAKRRAYLDDFQKTAGGEYVYDGTYYSFCTEGGKTRAGALARLWALCGAMAAFTVVGGCLDANGMLGCFYVIIPYVLEVGLVGSCVWAMVRLSVGGEPMRAYVYRASAEALPRRAAFAAAFALLALAAEVVFLLINGFGGKTVPTMVYLLLKLLTVAFALWLRACISRISWLPREKM